jgi:hypothetical protein
MYVNEEYLVDAGAWFRFLCSKWRVGNAKFME